MTDPITAYYIATVWFSDAEDEVGSKQLVRLPATSPEDFQTQVRQSWPFKVVTFGPVSLSKVQA
jgi:hypothetical protein